MSTIINTPRSQKGDNTGLGLALGILIAVVIVALVLFIGSAFSGIRDSQTQVPSPNDSIDLEVQVPAVPDTQAVQPVDDQSTGTPAY